MHLPSALKLDFVYSFETSAYFLNIPEDLYSSLSAPWEHQISRGSISLPYHQDRLCDPVVGCHREVENLVNMDWTFGFLWIISYVVLQLSVSRRMAIPHSSKLSLSNRRRIRSKTSTMRKSCHGSGGELPTPFRGGQRSIPDQFLWGLCWEMWKWNRFFSDCFGFLLPLASY